MECRKRVLKHLIQVKTQNKKTYMFQDFYGSMTNFQGPTKWKLDAETWCLQNPIQDEISMCFELEENVDLNGFVASPLRWDFKTSRFRRLFQ